MHSTTIVGEDGLHYRVCTKCHAKLPATTDYFTLRTGRGANKTPGLRTECRECRKKQRKVAGFVAPDAQADPDKTRRCRGCARTLPATGEFFAWNSKAANRLSTLCRECWREYQGSRVIHPPTNDPSRAKRCRGCGKDLPMTTEHFYPNPAVRSGLASRCVGCAQRRSAAPERRLQRALAHARRRARLLSLEGHFTADDIHRLHEQQGGRCAYCQGELGEYEIEHVIPVSQPGATNWPSNLVLACRRCNRNKHGKTPEQWVRRWYRPQRQGWSPLTGNH